MIVIDRLCAWEQLFGRCKEKLEMWAREALQYFKPSLICDSGSELRRPLLWFVSGCPAKHHAVMKVRFFQNLVFLTDL